MDLSANIDLNDDFARMVLSNVPCSPPKVPSIFKNKDGDCVEVLISHESFKAQRLDKYVTVYYGQETNEIVGWLVKGINRFIKEIVSNCPGFAIEIRGQRVKFLTLFTAGMWKQGDDPVVRTYKELCDKAEPFDLEAELECGAC